MSDKSKRKNEGSTSRKLLFSPVIFITLVFVFGAMMFFLQQSNNRYLAEMMTSTLEAEMSQTAMRSTDLALTTTLDSNMLGSTVTPTQRPNCFFTWAYNDAHPQDYDEAQKLLSDAGFENFSIKLPAHGEDQVCMQGEEVVSSRFLLMDISPEFILRVDPATLQDEEKLGAQAQTIVDLLANSDKLPKIYRVTISFSNGDESLRWIMEFKDATDAITAKIGVREFWELGIKSD